MPRLVFSAAAIALMAFAAQAPAPEAAIRRVLADQQAAWNRGDVRAFMEGYEDSPETTFVGSAVTRGRADILARYLKRYDTREKMGALEFRDIEVRPLSADYASVIGRFRLTRQPAGGGDAGGIFTLLFRRTPNGWKIILDHTNP